MAPSAVGPALNLLTTDTTSLTKAAPKTSLPKTISNGLTAHLADLDASKLTITYNLNPRPVPALNSPEVWSQKVATDHMLTCTWTVTSGWGVPEVKPYGPLSIMPTASVLHYATECFEGMKAYRGYDGKLRLFRPERNCARMLKSSLRIALPAFDPQELQKLIEKFIAIEAPRWLPETRKGSFLYLRPTMIGTAPAIGVQKPAEALLYILAVCFPPLDEPEKAPAGVQAPCQQVAYAATGAEKNGGAKGMRLLASKEDMCRAWPGGFGNAKLGANYGPSFIAQGEAKERGYHQVLWLLGEDCYVTEAGASNFFVLWRTRDGKLQLVTAPLTDGVILDGVTRGSVLDLVREKLAGEVDVVERRYTMHEIVEAAEEGRLVEAFNCGTAFFVVAVRDIHFRGKDIELPLAKGHEAVYATSIKQWLKDIMYGNVEHEWGVVVDEEAATSAEPSPSALDRANEWLQRS
jgi:branched-chain amino acid aminotransferase